MRGAFCRERREAVQVRVLAREADKTRPIAIAPNRLGILKHDLENVARAIRTRNQYAKTPGRRARAVFLQNCLTAYVQHRNLRPRGSFSADQSRLGRERAWRRSRSQRFRLFVV